MSDPSMLRALIVDDEPLARERVKMFLRRHDDFEIAGECSDGMAARSAIARVKPDVLFLDIEMPELSGMDVARELPRQELPVVLFLTAHAEHAVDAFEASAIDYLLKPFTQQRFDQALERARRFVDVLRPAARAPERIAVKKSRGRIVLVRVAEIRWIAAEGNYARLYTANGAFLVRDSMQSLEQTLGAAFVRIHRSTIVNVDRVAELQCDDEGSHTIVLDGGEELSVGPKYRENMARLLEALRPL